MNKLKKAFIVTVVIIVVLILGSRIYTHGKSFRLSTSSMEPFLSLNDVVFINKDISNIKRHDIVVFRFPTEDKNNKYFNKLFVFRVIGLPRETLEVKDKQIIVDGVVQNEPFVQHTDSEVKPWGLYPRDNLGPIIIPDDHVFVMGDNRDQTFDSRFWGTLPISSIKGKVILVFSRKSGFRKITH